MKRAPILIAVIICMLFPLTCSVAQNVSRPSPAEQHSTLKEPPVAATQGLATSMPQAPVPRTRPGVQSSEILLIDLANALQRARSYNQEFLAAGIASSLAREDRIQAKAA